MNEERVWVEVDLQKLRSNVQSLKKWQNKEICAVVKADAYGMGVVAVAKGLESLAQAYGVATLEEGILLRRIFKEKSIFVLGKMLNSELKDAIKHNLTISIDSIFDAENISNEAKKQGKVATVQLAIDTGMSRLGIKYDEDFFETARKIFSFPNINVVGIFSHYADSDNNENLTASQTAKFLKAKQDLLQLGYGVRYCHICNSGGCINCDADFCNMSRLGIAMYGISCKDCRDMATKEVFSDVGSEILNTSKNTIVQKLQGVASLWTRIIKIFYLKKGQGVGYSHTFVAAADMKVAVVACGYADGYPLAMSNRGYCIVGGQRARVVGKVCMDMLELDISNIGGAEVGTKVLLWECENSSSVSLKKLCKLCDSSEYEMLTRLGKRVKRVYINDLK